MIFRRRRVRIEVEESRLTLGFTRSGPDAADAANSATTPNLPLLPPTHPASNPPLVTKGKSTPEGIRHVE